MDEPYSTMEGTVSFCFTQDNNKFFIVFGFTDVFSCDKEAFRRKLKIARQQACAINLPTFANYPIVPSSV